MPTPPRPRRRKTAPPQRWWRGRRLTRYGREAISVLVLVGTLLLREREAAIPVAKREEEGPPVWATDIIHVQDDGGRSVGGIPLPAGPLKHQQRPPCGGVEEYAINGGCWVLTGHAPCSSVVYVHAGRCYVPSKMSARLPTSIEE